MSYAVVRTDKMFGTDNRAGLVSIKYLPTVDDAATPTAIENGNVLQIGDLVEGEREVFVGTAPAANTAINEVCLIATPEVIYDERYKDLADYINEAGVICRGYRFHSGDIFSVTKDALDGAADPAGSTVLGKIIAIDVVGKYTFYAIMVD